MGLSVWYGSWSAWSPRCVYGQWICGTLFSMWGPLWIGWAFGMTWLLVVVRGPGDLDGRWICGALISVQGPQSVCKTLSMAWLSVAVGSQSGSFSPGMCPEAWHFWLFAYFYFYIWGPTQKIMDQIRWVFSFWRGVPGVPQKVRTPPWGNPGYATAWGRFSNAPLVQTHQMICNMTTFWPWPEVKKWS